jgi:hypothetical protein
MRQFSFSGLDPDPGLCDRDRAMIDTLKTIGIQKGKRFEPDARARQILENALAEAHAWLDA